MRLKYAYVVKCDEVVRDSAGKVLELKATYDPVTRAGASPEGSIKAKGIVQWVSADHAIEAEVMLYDRLFNRPQPGSEHEDRDFLRDLNPDSIKRYPNALLERSVGLPGGHMVIKSVIRCNSRGWDILRRQNQRGLR